MGLALFRLHEHSAKKLSIFALSIINTLGTANKECADSFGVTLQALEDKNVTKKEALKGSQECMEAIQTIDDTIKALKHHRAELAATLPVVKRRRSKKMYLIHPITGKKSLIKRGETINNQYFFNKLRLDYDAYSISIKGYKLAAPKYFKAVHYFGEPLFFDSHLQYV